MRPKKLITGMIFLCTYLALNGQNAPEIVDFGGTALDSAWTLSDSTFCKGGTLEIHGRHFIQHGPGNQWDSTSVWLGGFMTGRRCNVLALNATQGGQSDEITIQLPDEYIGDTCLSLTLIRYTSGLFGTVPAAVSDTICLSGGFAQITSPDTVFCLGDTSPVLSAVSHTPGSFVNVSGNPGLLILSNGTVPLHSGATGTHQRIDFISPHPVCPDTTTVYLSIEPKQVPVVMIGSSAVHCPLGTVAADTSSLWPKGGQFRANSPDLVVLDDSLGVIDLGASKPGQYEMLYFVDAPCWDTARIPLTILPRDSVVVNYPIAQVGAFQRLCENAPPVAPVFNYGPSGGTFTALSNDLVLDSTGVIYPSISQPGNYAVMYESPGYCPDTFPAALNIRLDTIPDAYFSILPTEVCGNDSIISLDSTTNFSRLEVYMGSSFVTSSAMPELRIDGTLSPGFTYNIMHIGPGVAQCRDTTYDHLTVLAPDTAIFSYPTTLYCQNASDPLPVLSGTGGGVFTAATPNTTVSPTGQIDLDASGPGQHTIQYTTSGACPDSTFDTVLIQNAVSADFYYVSQTFCQSAPNPLATMQNVGGVFSADTFGLVLDSVSGEIDLQNSVPGTYVVTYEFSGSCEDRYNQSVTVLAADSTTTMHFPADTFCVDSAAPVPIVQGDSVGGFIGSPGLAFFNPSIGSVDLTRTAPGTYGVTYDLTNPCATDPTDSITVQDSPNINYSYSDPEACAGDAPYTCQSNPLSAVQGIFSGPSGILIDSLGTIYPAQSQPGTYTVTFTSTGQCPAVESQTITIHPTPQNMALVASDTEICEEESIELMIQSPDGVAFLFYRQGMPVDSGGVVFVADSVQDGEVFAAQVENAFGCTATDSLTISVSPRPMVSVFIGDGAVFPGGDNRLDLLSDTDDTEIRWQLRAEGMVLDSGTTTATFANQSIPLTLQLNSGDLPPAYYTLSLHPEAAGCPGDSLNIPLESIDDPIFIPEVFTPNGDGHNDQWTLRWTDTVDPNDYEVLIFNRAGGQVARVAPLHGNWDGGSLPDGVYWWSLRDTRGRDIRQGGLTIKRK